jgi:C4-dicarboxylate transporter DctQ subunit
LHARAIQEDHITFGKVGKGSPPFAPSARIEPTPMCPRVSTRAQALVQCIRQGEFKPMEKLSRIFDLVISSGIVLGGVLLVLVMFFVNAEIFTRYIAGHSLIWVVEISETSLLFITFLGVAWVLKRGGHVSVDILVNRLSPRRRSMLNAVTSIVGALAVFPLIWYGAQVTWTHYQKGLYEATALEIPNAAVLFIIPLGSLLLFIQLLKKIHEYVREWRGDK